MIDSSSEKFNSKSLIIDIFEFIFESPKALEKYQSISYLKFSNSGENIPYQKFTFILHAYKKY